MIGSRRRVPMTARALYVVPHQDDEQLSFGNAIRTDLEAGRAVDALLITDGRWAVSRTQQPMVDRLGRTATPEEYAAQRDKEFAESVRRLGARPILPAPQDRIIDGGSTKATTKALILKYGKPGAMLRGTSQYDYHVDHRAVGDALVELEDEGFGTNLRLYQSAWSYINGYGPSSGVTRIDNPPFPLVYQWPYRFWDAPNGWWGIGYTDVPDHFNLLSGIDTGTYWHLPDAGEVLAPAAYPGAIYPGQTWPAHTGA